MHRPQRLPARQLLEQRRTKKAKIEGNDDPPVLKRDDTKTTTTTTTTSSTPSESSDETVTSSEAGIEIPSGRLGSPRWQILLTAMSDRLDPFSSLPEPYLSKGEEFLIKFYLLQYPQVTYGFSQRLHPHPVATNFSIALDYSACFQVILARSALYRMTLRRYGTEKEKKALELGMLAHKQKAIQIIRKLSVSTLPSNRLGNDQLIASIISLGTLDRRSGSDSASETHFAEVRKLMKAAGGPGAIRDVSLGRVVLFFECIYGTPIGSYIWEANDLNRLHTRLNQQLELIASQWALSMENASASDEEQNTYPCRWLTTGTKLHQTLSRFGPVTEPTSPSQKAEIIFQLAGLFSLALIVLEYIEDPELLHSHEAHLIERVDRLQLSDRDSCSNVLWLIQINDFADRHKALMWEAAASTWVCKFLSIEVRLNVRQYLLRFLTGEQPVKALQLGTYHFSYASQSV